MQILDEISKLPNCRVYQSSHTETAWGEAVMVRLEDRPLLAVTGELRGCFHGQDRGDLRLCPTDHENRLALNRVFPFTAPVALGRRTSSFGFGDRLGYANPAQLRAIAGTPLRPVLAQQSLRELSLTGRTNEQVIDVAAWAVFRAGYREGYASDGDHLKSAAEIAAALQAGCTMITLDCSLVLEQCGETEAARPGAFAALPADLQAAYRSAYLNSEAPAAFGLRYTEADLVRFHKIYGKALGLIRQVYFDLLLPLDHPVDLEVSLDETEETTSPAAHYFVASEMERMGVAATSVAPKFVGEFQKAIDYIGDLAELEKTMTVHANIADRFGYKLSLHSGSEKYSVLPILAKATHGRFHVKTSGTSWLEVVETIAKHDPALYRRMHRVALDRIDDARKFYVVHCDVSKVRPLDETPDEALPDYLALGNNDSRQLMHITYGFILEIPALKQDILRFLDQHLDLYEREIVELYQRHVTLLQ